MSRVVLPGKYTNESVSEIFDFASRLLVGETISSAITTATVYSGSDPAPSALISGASTVSGTKVTQKVIGGLSGVTYMLKCSATTSTPQVLSLSGLLTILPDSA